MCNHRTRDTALYATASGRRSGDIYISIHRPTNWASVFLPSPTHARPITPTPVSFVANANKTTQRLCGGTLTQVEDVVAHVWASLVGVGAPMLHVVRLCFGLSLLFYGMAFRTFAFHVIIFRIAGFKHVSKQTRSEDSPRWVLVVRTNLPLERSQSGVYERTEQKKKKNVAAKYGCLC